MSDPCESGACVEVTNYSGHIRLRSSVTGTAMQCTVDEWESFLSDLAEGKWAHVTAGEEPHSFVEMPASSIGSCGECSRPAGHANHRMADHG